MSVPAKVVMDDLAAVADALRGDERYGEALGVDALIEAANAAGHLAQSMGGVVSRVRVAVDAVQHSDDPLGEDVIALVEGALAR